MIAKTRRDRQEQTDYLRGILRPGDTVYTVLRHRSRSGMYRVLDLYVFRDNEPLQLTYSAAAALEWRYDKRHDGLGVSGAGMDMGFHAVYSLARVLFPDGFACSGDKCPSNDHYNRDSRHNTYHVAGGYALQHKWL